MQAGDLDRKIVIEYPAVSRNAEYGTEEVTWLPLDGYEVGSPTTAKTIAASIRDGLLASRIDTVRNGIELARGQSKMWIRYRTGIDSTMRVREPARNNQIYHIIAGPAEVGRREWLEFIIEKYSTLGANK